MVLAGWSFVLTAAGAPPSSLLAIDAELGEVTARLDESLRACGEGLGWPACFRLEVAGGVADPPPVLGSYREIAGRLAFRPRFAWDPDVRYVALVLDLEGRVRERLEIAPRTHRAPATRVLGVEPATRTVPANLLRLYVSFSAPMLGKEVGRHVGLLDADGAEIEDALVDVSEGLWDGEHRRLTLFVHPGRIKRGVGPHEALGPALVAGRSYRLRIDSSLLDAAGRPLAEDFEHPFVVGPDDRSSPEPSVWRLDPPRDATSPLTVRTDGLLDPVLARRLLRVVDVRDHAVETELRVAGDTLSFQPRSPWSPGLYRLEIDPALEDLAGNRPGRLFEVPTAGSDPAAELTFGKAPGSAPADSSLLYRSFEVEIGPR